MPSIDTTEVPVMTLCAKLERDRLTRRARRVRAVIVAVRRQAGGERAAAHADTGHMLQTIAEFEAELAAIDARLSGLATEATSAQRRSDLPRDWTTT